MSTVIATHAERNAERLVIRVCQRVGVRSLPSLSLPWLTRTTASR
jgi:hypothetical protein